MKHTLYKFYGPPSSGKLTLARQLIAVHTHMPVALVERLTPHAYQLRDKEFPFYKTNVHFEMSVADFVPNHQKALIELLQELSKTLNVSRNSYKIILLHEADQLSRPIQYQLRRMMEVFYTTCRLVFLSHSLDRLDQTLQSRFVCVRVPRPRSELMRVLVSTAPNPNPNPPAPSSPPPPIGAVGIGIGTSICAMGIGNGAVEQRRGARNVVGSGASKPEAEVAAQNRRRAS